MPFGKRKKRSAGIGKAVAILGVLLAAWVGLVQWHHQLTADFQTAWAQAKAQKQQAEFLLNNSGNERVLMARHLPLLQTLGARSIYGPAKRLEWVEHLRGIEKRYLGVTLHYDIAGEVLLPSQGSHPIDPMGVFLTTMTLNLGVFHEGDVLVVLDDIKAADLGYFYVRQCVLTRPEVSAPASNAKLTATCELNWLHIKPLSPTLPTAQLLAGASHQPAALDQSPQPTQSPQSSQSPQASQASQVTQQPLLPSVNQSSVEAQLGRLLTTPLERKQWDAARQQLAASPAAGGVHTSASGAPTNLGANLNVNAGAGANLDVPKPAVWRVSGITRRQLQARGQVTVWLDGTPYSEHELPQGVHLVRHKNGDILGVASRLKNNQTGFAKVGEDLPRPP